MGPAAEQHGRTEYPADDHRPQGGSPGRDDEGVGGDENPGNDGAFTFFETGGFGDPPDHGSDDGHVHAGQADDVRQAGSEESFVCLQVDGLLIAEKQCSRHGGSLVGLIRHFREQCLPGQTLEGQDGFMEGDAGWSVENGNSIAGLDGSGQVDAAAVHIVLKIKLAGVGGRFEAAEDAVHLNAVQ